MKLCIWPRYELRDAGRITRLGDIEGRMMLAFFDRQAVPQSRLIEAAWPNPDEMPDTWAFNLGVRIYRLRKKLQPFRTHSSYDRQLGLQAGTA